jgi:hypothetical protein
LSTLLFIEIEISPYVVEQFASTRDISCLDLSKSLRLRRFRKSKEFDVTLHRHVPAKVRKLHLDQLLGIQRAVPVPEKRRK